MFEAKVFLQKTLALNRIFRIEIKNKLLIFMTFLKLLKYYKHNTINKLMTTTQP